jgi:hypothetical protein
MKRTAQAAGEHVRPRVVSVGTLTPHPLLPTNARDHLTRGRGGDAGFPTDGHGSARGEMIAYTYTATVLAKLSSSILENNIPPMHAWPCR